MAGRQQWLVYLAAATVASCSVPMVNQVEGDAAKPRGQFIRLQEAIAIIQREYITPVDANALINAARTSLHQDAGVAHECEQTEPAPNSLSMRSLEKEYDCIVASNPSLEPNRVIDNAISSLMPVLDFRSKYVSADDEKENSLKLNNVASIGLELIQEAPGLVFVMAPFPFSPAELLGIKPGDRLVEIDGKTLSNQSLQTVVDWLHGPYNSEISIALERDNHRLEFVTRRVLVKLDPVDSELLRDGIGYIKVRSFLKNTGSLIQEHVRKLRMTNGQNLGGIIIDLRNNPGGVLYEIVVSADTFIEDGNLFRTSGRGADSKLNFRASKGDLTGQTPIAVLVNGGTAAGAELLAAILHDRRQAKIIGTRTFGLDTVRTMINLQGGGKLLITTARMYRPSEVPFESVGILPDICVISANEIKSIDQSSSRESDANNLICPPQMQGYENREQDIEFRTALDLLKLNKLRGK